MGLGDHIIATGEVERRLKVDPRPKLLMHGHRAPKEWRAKPYWHPFFNGNPNILQDETGEHEKLYIGKDARPYIDYSNRENDRLAYVEGWQVYPGRLYCDDDSPVSGHVVIEPNAKRPNKRWGGANYQQVVDAFPDVKWVQVGADGRTLKNVKYVKTESPAHVFPIMRDCLFYVGPEGFLHHAAAAFRKPAVVLFGGVSPLCLSYDFQHSIFAEPACGMLTPCMHCQQVWKNIRPEHVIGLVGKTLADIQGIRTPEPAGA